MKTLYQFQQDGVNFLINGGSLLAFQPGAGKTVTALEACKRISAHRVLVICPAVALAVWRDEIRDHWPECTSLYLRDVIKAPVELYRLCAEDKPFVLITGYEYLVVNQRAQEIVVNSRYDALICDEAHALKNPTAKRTIAVYGPGCQREGGIASLADRIWLLSGTPVLNHVGELFPHLRALAPERIEQGSYQGFVHHYCEIGMRMVYLKQRAGQKAKTKDIETITGSKRSELPDLAKRLRGFWYKPPLNELNRQLPSLRLVVRTLPPDACDTTALAGLEDSDEARMLREAIDKGLDLSTVAGQVSRIRRLLALAKVDATVAWVEDLFDQGVAKVGVWGWHTEALHAVAEALAPHGVALIDGATPTNKRSEIVQRFQQDLECRAFIGQIQAAGTAITLTAANRAVFLEQSFVPALNAQALKRHHRIGQTQPVLGEALVIDGSIDEAVGAIIARKSADIRVLEESA